MTIREHVNDLFADYPNTRDLREFKEELAAHLNDRISDLIKNGMSESEANAKALSELGDVTGIADDISRSKRNEVISRMYTETEPKIDWKHALGFTLAVLSFIAGGFFMLLSKSSNFNETSAIIGTLIFYGLSVALFTFNGLTQETRKNFPMGGVRAFLYALSASALFTGAAFAAMCLWVGNYNEIVFGVFAIFGIPALGLLIFLLMTQRKRYKPWFMEERERIVELYRAKNVDMFDGETWQSVRFGLWSGVLWIATALVYIAMGYTIGWHPTWLVFIVAIVGELLLLLRFGRPHA